jgi:hypothetical protein
MLPRMWWMRLLFMIKKAPACSLQPEPHNREVGTSGMKIVVKELTSKTLAFEVEPSATISSIKTKVLDAVGMNANLIFRGKELHDDCTLAECEVEDGSVLSCVLPHVKGTRGKCSDEIMVNIVTPTRKIISLHPQRYATIADIKEQIFCYEGILSSLQLLFFEGFPLADDSLIREMSTLRDSTLHLLMCPSQLDMTPELLLRICCNDSSLTSLELLGQDLDAAGFQALADALSRNTCITSLNMFCSSVGPTGCSVLMPALAHLSSMTALNLSGTSLQSSGVPYLCDALQYLTALTELDVSFNMLTADDAARVCCSIAAAGTTTLKSLNLSGNIAAASGVVGCGWLSVLSSLQELTFNGILYDFRIVFLFYSLECRMTRCDGGCCSYRVFKNVLIRRLHSFCCRKRFRRVWCR